MEAHMQIVTPCHVNVTHMASDCVLRSNEDLHSRIKIPT